ncbi:DNA cytosine methyltransferase, partial [Peptoniphilus genitalis]
MKLTVAEQFAGVGGFRVGLNHIDSIDENGLAIENGDWKFVWANQFEPSTRMQPAFECYVKRFGEEKNSNVDINKVDKKEIPDHSLLVGGFPCQDYSVARSLSKEMGI